MDSPPAIDVQLRVGFRHQVHITRRVFDRSNPLLASLLQTGARRCIAVIDSNVAQALPNIPEQLALYADTAGIELPLAPLVISGGERAKDGLHELERIYDAIESANLCRRSCVIAVGGGAVLDVAGFAAATAHRGVRLIRLPTTTLAQGDAGVGVKNGFNAFGKKNYIGTFAPPFAVVNDLEFLLTQPTRSKRSGLSEAVKVALIRDAAFFEWLEAHATQLRALDGDVVEELVCRTAKLHVQHIATAGDPFEFGAARPLDFGHWSAHKLEQMSNYALMHGEAVAIGIALDVLFSNAAGSLAAAGLNRVMAVLETIGFDLWSSELDHEEELLEGLEEFRQHLGGELTVTMLERIGSGIEIHQIDRASMRSCIHELRRRAFQRAAA